MYKIHPWTLTYPQPEQHRALFKKPSKTDIKVKCSPIYYPPGSHLFITLSHIYFLLALFIPYYKDKKPQTNKPTFCLTLERLAEGMLGVCSLHNRPLSAVAPFTSSAIILLKKVSYSVQIFLKKKLQCLFIFLNTLTVLKVRNWKMALTELKPRCCKGCIPLGVLGKNQYSCFFSVSRCHLHPLAFCTPLPPSEPVNLSLVFLILLPPQLSFWLAFSTF